MAVGDKSTVLSIAIAVNGHTGKGEFSFKLWMTYRFSIICSWPGNFFFGLGWSYSLSIIAGSLPQQKFGRAVIDSNISDCSTGGCATRVAGKEY